MRAHTTSALPIVRNLTLVILSSVLGAGCGCPTRQGIKPVRAVSGHLTYQPPDAAPVTGDLGPTASFDTLAEVSGGHPDEIVFSLSPYDTSQGVNPPTVRARLIIPVGLRVASQELDLTDDNTTLMVTGPPAPATYHGLTGHLTLQGLDTTCQFSCPLRAHGTVAVSAAGPNDEVFALTSGTFAANDETYDYELCQD